MNHKRTPWTRQQLDELIPIVKARMAEAEAEQVEAVKPLSPMTIEECKDYFFRLMDLAAQRPLTQRECFIHGQLLAVYKQAIQAEMLGRKGGRYFVIPEADIDELMRSKNGG